MTQKNKLVDMFKRNPESISLKKITKILDIVGYEEVRIKRSHVVYKKFGCVDVVIPVHGNDCKPFYKRQIYKIIKHLL